MIRLEKLRFHYQPGQEIFSNLTHEFAEGHLHGVIGPSGCGKTTLLYLLAGLLRPTAGSVLFRNRAIVRGRERTAVILQDHGLFPWKTVYENMALGLRLRKCPRAAEHEHIQGVLRELGLDGKESRFPGALSGGERQRLAIGRALVLDPDLLLLDEPFSSLDALTREQLQDKLTEVRDRRSLTMILVTHSVEEAAYLSDRIHVMGRDGRLAAIENTSPRLGYRKTPEFFARCVEVRGALERQTAGRSV